MALRDLNWQPLEHKVRFYSILMHCFVLWESSSNSSSSFYVEQMNMDLSVADGHLCNMGKMIEEMEGKLRNSLDQVLLG